MRRLRGKKILMKFLSAKVQSTDFKEAVISTPRILGHKIRSVIPVNRMMSAKLTM